MLHFWTGMTYHFNLCLPKAVIKISTSCCHPLGAITKLYFLYPDNFKNPVEKRKGWGKHLNKAKTLAQNSPGVPFCLTSTLQAKAERKAGLTAQPGSRRSAGSQEMRGHGARSLRTRLWRFRNQRSKRCKGEASVTKEGLTRV